MTKLRHWHCYYFYFADNQVNARQTTCRCVNAGTCAQNPNSGIDIRIVNQVSWNIDKIMKMFRNYKSVWFMLIYAIFRETIARRARFGVAENQDRWSTALAVWEKSPIRRNSRSGRRDTDPIRGKLLSWPRTMFSLDQVCFSMPIIYWQLLTRSTPIRKSRRLSYNYF